MMAVWILMSFVAGVLFGTAVMALCQVSKKIASLRSELC